MQLGSPCCPCCTWSVRCCTWGQQNRRETKSRPNSRICHETQNPNNLRTKRREHRYVTRRVAHCYASTPQWKQPSLACWHMGQVIRAVFARILAIKGRSPWGTQSEGPLALRPSHHQDVSHPVAGLSFRHIAECRRCTKKRKIEVNRIPLRFFGFLSESSFETSVRIGS